MSYSLSEIAVAILLVLFLPLLITKAVYGTRKQHSFPPGPYRWPLIGNALQMPKAYPFLAFSDWTKKYGDIIYAEVFGSPILILSSAKVANDLLDKRSSLYSDRPHLVMAGDLVGVDEPLVMRPYGDDWRKQRKFVAQQLAPNVVQDYHTILEREARNLVWGLLEDPDSLVNQIKLRIGTVIMRVTYGYDVKSEDDPFLVSGFEAIEVLSRAIEPGAWLVDFVPQLRYIPKWMPGSGFRKVAAQWRQALSDAAWKPYIWLKKNLETGAVQLPNLCTSVLLSEENLSKKDETLLVWAAATVLGGGLDTNMGTILTFFLAMVLHPEVQAKIKVEIDSVVGLDRIPSVSDRVYMPYTRSVVVEVLRWMPALPSCVPHSLMQDDYYEGMHLPKGAMLIPNIWHMLHDPKIYPDPMQFNPDRYNKLDSEMEKVNDVAFGFGRRACPGRYLAEEIVFVIVATVIATCEILPAVDADGRDIIPEEAYYTLGTIIVPKPFQCRMKGRSKEALAMLSHASLSAE